MLIVKRKMSEALMINDNTRIIILEIKNHSVKLGVQAPTHIAIDREEIFLQKQEKKNEIKNYFNENTKEIGENNEK